MKNMFEGRTGTVSSFRRLAYLGASLAVLSVTLSAQDSRFAFDVGGGFSEPRGTAGTRLDRGWNVKAGAGYKFSPYFSLMVDTAYNRFGINQSTLNRVGFPGGNVNVFSATLDPVVHLSPGRYADVYITGGGGLYRVAREFTQPGVAQLVGFDPFFGLYSQAVPTTQILSSYSVNKPGVNLGIGFAVGSKWNGKFFAEAKYNRVFMGNDLRGDYIPVSFGFRW